MSFGWKIGNERGLIMRSAPRCLFEVFGSGLSC
jgi:hypothetical protein